MPREKYFLFVDEVKPSNQYFVYNYTGIAIKENKHTIFANNLNLIKDNSLGRLGGRQVNLHFSNLIQQKKDTIFETLTLYEEQSLWRDLYKLFLNTEYYVLSGVVHNKYNFCYRDHRVSLEMLAFKTLLQNFARFLYLINGYGEIIIESSNDDEKIREEYYRTKFTGSKYITAEGYNHVIRSITFEKKDKLIEGLQLVDCIANPISRLVCGLNQFELNKFGTMDYMNILNTKIFDGNVNNIYEYGIRKLFV